VPLLRAVRRAADEDGIAVLLIEHHVTQVLRSADRADVVRPGDVVLSCGAAEVRQPVLELEGSYITRQPDADTNEEEPA
jgi:ABC-type branched-subunit amino acid transport system ATPase component